MQISSSMAKTISKAQGFINTVMNLVSGGLIGLLMFLITADCAGRYLFNKPVPGSLEMAISMMVLIVFLAFPYAEATGRHLKVDLVTERFGLRTQGMLVIFGCAGMLFLFAIFAWQGWAVAWMSFEEREFLGGALKLPAYVPKFAVPVGTFFVCLQVLNRMIGKVLQLLEI